MQELFFEVAKLNLIGSLFALTVMVVRLIFRKAPKWIFCILWGIVALRLICPFSIESHFSLVPDRIASGQIITTVGESYIGSVDIIYENDAEYSSAVEAGREPIYSGGGYYVVTEKNSLEAPKTIGETVYPVVWVAGVALMLTYTAVSYLALRKKMEEATHLQDNIWQCEQVDSPFVLGLIRPRIYLPYAISDSDTVNVIAHEQAHIQRKDHWWKPIGFVLLSIHWFNPVLWLAYILLCRDIEAACDEKVIAHMNKEEMRAYSTALLHCSVRRRRIAACPLAFGEVGVKERIKRVMNYKKPAFWIILLVVAVSTAAGLLLLTDPVGKITPFEETYEYSVNRKNYIQPATVDGWVEKAALETATEDGTFFCFTTDSAQADEFINAQRTLLCYLKDRGVEIGEMEYYGTDYSYCFSKSDDRAAYVALSSTKSWQQVLVTLQAIWGDYTDYGYVYAMSNAIAKDLDWRAESAPSVEHTLLDAFFSENPDALHLLYPTFTTRFSSEETVNNSKALVIRIFEKNNWRKALGKPIEDQLNEYYALVSSYAKKLSVPFTRQTCGYAYYGEEVPLRIMTAYAELIIDGDYKDIKEAVFGDYFSHYESIYRTANIIDQDISASVARFGIENEVGKLAIKFLDSEDPVTKRYVPRSEKYYYSTKTIYVTSVWLYLHEYYEHIELALKQKASSNWQSQAFYGIGDIHSRHFLYLWEHSFTHDPKCVDLFEIFTGRGYRSGKDDLYEAMDILCYINDYYTLNYDTIMDAKLSITGYLIELFGEDAISNVMLYPETVEQVTGKTWKELETQWQQHIRDKYAGIEIPNWVDDYF